MNNKEHIHNARSFEDENGDLAIGAWLKKGKPHPVKLVKVFNWDNEDAVNVLVQKINNLGEIQLKFWKECSLDDFWRFDEDGYHAARETADSIYLN